MALKNLSNKPSNINVVKYMYKWYNETNDELWCKSCNRVIKPWKNESHLDTCIPISYYPNITAVFKCVPCGMVVDGFKQMTYHHVGTQKHLDRCNSYDERLYSNECVYSKTVVYDTYKSIIDHSYDKNALFPIKCLPLISVFMAELYKIREAAEQGHSSVSFIYCSVCEEWSVGLMESAKHETHLNTVPLQSYNYLATFYCDSCNVTFFCDECTYKVHQSSVEHATLLEMCERKVHDEQYEGWKLPPIVRHYFEKSPVKEDRGLEKTVCNLCGITVAVGDEAVLKHLFESCTVWSVAEPPVDEDLTPADYNSFYCGCCSMRLDHVTNWRRHVLSVSHLMNCSELFRYSYFECPVCLDLYAGMIARQVDDKTCHHELQPIDLSEMMHFVYKTMNTVAGKEPDGLTFYYWQETGNFGQCDRSDQPESVPNYCPTCRLEFYGDPISFRKHTFMIEHLLLQYFKPISSVSDTEEDAYVRELVSRLKIVRRPLRETEIDLSLDITHSLCYEFLKKIFKN